MPKDGDVYTVELKEAHLNWGEHRETETRDFIPGEAYIPVPRKYAKEYQVYNNNKAGAITSYNCKSKDGSFSCELLAQGASEAGDIYAKQFAGRGDLKALGGWFQAVGATVGGFVKVQWTSPTDIIISYLPSK